MDDQLRQLERRAIEGDTWAIGVWITSRRRAGEYRVVHDGDLVAGEYLGLLLHATLAATGKREVELLRAAGVAEQRLGRAIDGLRALMRGERRPWSLVQTWAPILGLDPGDLALVAQVVPFERGRRPAPAAPSAYPVVSCANCAFRMSMIAIGLGVRCSSKDSSIGDMGHVPALSFSCSAFAPRAAVGN